MERRYVSSLVLFYESIKISQTKYLRKRKQEEERTRDSIIAVWMSVVRVMAEVCINWWCRSEPEQQSLTGYVCSGLHRNILTLPLGGDLHCLMQHWKWGAWIGEGGASGVCDGFWILLVTWPKRRMPSGLLVSSQYLPWWEFSLPGRRTLAW